MQPFCDLVGGKFGVPLTVVDCYWNLNYIAGTTNLGELRKMIDVVTKANNEVKDHGSKASIFGKFAGWREQEGETRFARPTDIPNRKVLKPGLGMTKTIDRYQLYDGIEAKVAVMHRDGERPHGQEEPSVGGSQSGNEYTERETFGKKS